MFDKYGKEAIIISSPDKGIYQEEITGSSFGINKSLEKWRVI